MTQEQQLKLCELYNKSDIEALDYMLQFCQNEWIHLLKRMRFLNLETDIGWGENEATYEETEEYYTGKWKLLKHFGINKNIDGEAYC